MNEQLTEDLKREIAARRCIAIIGAGVSIFSTDCPCASWAGLLRHGVQRCVAVVPDLPTGWAERANADIDSGDLDGLLASAEKVSRKLGAPQGGEYARWLRESVGALQTSHMEVLEALKDLDVVLGTTNYDDLIEKVTGLPAVTWMDGARVERVLRGDETAVVHLHGYWQRPESVILSIRSYEQVLGSERAQAMLRAMTAMQTILFVGCGEGLRDPNFGALLEWTGKVFAGSEYRRFRLARTGEVEQLQKEHPLGQRLFVLGYGEGFADLAPFLRTLRRAAERPVKTTVPPAGLATLPPRPLEAPTPRELVEHKVAASPKVTPPSTSALDPPKVSQHSARSLKEYLVHGSGHRLTVTDYDAARVKFRQACQEAWNESGLQQIILAALDRSFGIYVSAIGGYEENPFYMNYVILEDMPKKKRARPDYLMSSVVNLKAHRKAIDDDADSTDMKAAHALLEYNIEPLPLAVITPCHFQQTWRAHVFRAHTEPLLVSIMTSDRSADIQQVTHDLRGVKIHGLEELLKYFEGRYNNPRYPYIGREIKSILHIPLLGRPSVAFTILINPDICISGAECDEGRYHLGPDGSDLNTTLTIDEVMAIRLGGERFIAALSHFYYDYGKT